MQDNMLITLDPAKTNTSLQTDLVQKTKLSSTIVFYIIRALGHLPDTNNLMKDERDSLSIIPFNTNTP